MNLEGSTVSSKLLIYIENWNFSVSSSNPADTRRDTSMFTMFGSSNDRVLLTIYPAELK